MIALLFALQQSLASPERKLVARVDAEAPQAIELLQKAVDINSGSLNRAGVKRVYDLFAPEFEKLGFTVRYVEQPDALARGGHLIAERKGKKGKRVLLIGHLDTVFEESSPFQHFQRIDSVTASGPGAEDMKGGDVVIIYALRALSSIRALDDRTITVVMTGDEESTGKPVSISRAPLIEAARSSDIALAFEGASRDSIGDMFAIARRSASTWKLSVTGRAAHSSGVFGERTGAGAIYEAARIVHEFYNELRTSPNATFNAAMIVGGNEAMLTDSGGTMSGKSNIVPQTAIVRGDIRTLTDEELAQIRAGMQTIVARHLPQTSAEITFDEGYPSMPVTPGGEALLAQIDAVNQALGLGPARAFPPLQRGAGDVSFVAKYIAGVDGLGASGSGGHTVRERVNLPSITTATKRAAVLIYRLTR